MIIFGAIALVGLVFLFLTRPKKDKHPQNLELRSKKEQQAFNPLSTIYNPKQYRRKRR